MKIIYITSSLPYGPGETFIISEIRELKRQGHDVLIVPMYPRGQIIHDDVKPLLDSVIPSPLFSLDILVTSLAVFFIFPLKALRILNWLFKSRNLKILLKNLAVYPKGLWLSRKASKWNADHIHAHWAATTATLAMIAGHITRIPWSFTAHRWDIAERNLLTKKVENACFSRAIDLQGARELAGYTYLKDKTPLVIHMGVDMPQPKYRDNQFIDKKIRIIMAANFVKKKGHIYLLQAVQFLREGGTTVQVDLAGDGPLINEIIYNTEKLGLKKNINFLGRVSHEKLIKLMDAGVWDVMVLPSIIDESGEKEGIPVSLIEAMSYNIPVISTTTGGIPELLDGGAGLLVPPENPVALANAISILAKNPELRKIFGETGRKRIEESFDVKKIVVELSKHFNSCKRANQ